MAPPPAPPVPPPPAPPRASPPQAPLPAVPPDDPSATGRSGGSRPKAPAVPPVAPRGRDTTDRPDDGRGPGYGDNGGSEARATAGGAGGQLLDDAERDRLGQRLHHVLARFVEAPRDSVAEAAEVLDEVEQRLVASLRDRRVALRAGWQENGDPDGPGPDTEQLRLTLRTYREVTERLLRA
ncbi:hypothetical protein [Streptomyces sp. NPDC004266]|uniref:hypothetical protein n=1 Tax=Streptomyces sp. NPDC004266 TaxID=3364693 RepID=UPI0036940F71